MISSACLVGNERLACEPIRPGGDVVAVCVTNMALNEEGGRTRCRKEIGATRDVNGSDWIGFCLYHILYHIFSTDSERIG